MPVVAVAIGDHQSAGARDDIALAQGRIVRDLDRGEADGILAVAGTACDELVAIAVGIRQVGIFLSGLRDRLVDVAAIDQRGLGRRAEAVAAVGLAFAVVALRREVAAVAGAYAPGLPAAIGTPARRIVARHVVGRERHPDLGRRPGTKCAEKR